MLRAMQQFSHDRCTIRKLSQLMGTCFEKAFVDNTISVDEQFTKRKTQTMDIDGFKRQRPIEVPIESGRDCWVTCRIEWGGQLSRLERTNVLI